MKSQRISRDRIEKILEKVKCTIFSVTFEKRSGGTRTMVCRRGVTKHLKGGVSAYSFSDKGLVSVYDVQKCGYRCFGIESVISIRANGKEYK